MADSRNGGAKASSGAVISRRLLALIVALVLVFGVAVGGTVAWLVARSDAIVNTFTYGDINIDLDETTGDEYEMIPGQTITKDPTVTVEADSVESWLFVKLEKSENFDDFMEYAIAEGWTALPDVDGVYYRETDRTDEEQTFAVLADNTVTVKETVTKAMLNALDQTDPPSYPTLTVTAYAVQKAGFETAGDAWQVVLDSMTS